MKRIFSGHSLGKNSSSRPGEVRALSMTAKYSSTEMPTRSASSSFSRIFSQGKEVSSMKTSTPSIGQQWPNILGNQEGLAPELAPIVTLLSAQGFRRYNDGMFLVLKDLKSDGTPAERVWREVYGVLIGTQLALWDPKVIAKIGCDEEQLAAAGCKPSYINFTDSSFKALTSGDAVTAAGKKRLTNTIAVSTTLKNRYFLQFSDEESFERWNAAFRLSAFEFTALQEAYTGALLSTRGSLLSDIQVVLADTKFDYEEWVNVRFGAGMRWKRCYVVISQPPKKGKGSPRMGHITFYESEKKVKKTAAMATVTGARAAYAIYPSSPLMIDSSTIIKLEGEVLFPGSDGAKETDIFMMPELHSAVPGYDTIIRFLIPTMNAFRLYGRPESLSAKKEDTNSLLFGLPTLPHVHYLQIDDLLDAARGKGANWGVYEWRRYIKGIIKRKIDQGYTGCGSTTGLTGAISSPALSSQSVKAFPARQSPQFIPSSRFASIDEAPSKNMRVSSAPLLKSRSGPVRPPVTSSALKVIHDRMEGSSQIANAPPPMVILDTLSESKVDPPRLPIPPKISSQATQAHTAEVPVVSPTISHTTSNMTSPPYPVAEYEKSETATISQDFINDRPLLPNQEGIPAPVSNYEAFTRLALTNEKKFGERSRDDEQVQSHPQINRPDLTGKYEKFTRSTLRVETQDLPTSDVPSMASDEIYDAYHDASVGNNLQLSAEGLATLHKIADGNSVVSNTLVGSVKDLTLEEDIGNVDVMDDFYNLSKEISKLAAEGLAATGLQEGKDRPYDGRQMDISHPPKDPNVFDPDYVEEQAFLIECDNKYASINRNLRIPSPAPLQSDSIFVPEDEYLQKSSSAYTTAGKNHGKPAIVRSPGHDNISRALAASHSSGEALSANRKAGGNQPLSPGRPPPPMELAYAHPPQQQQQYGGYRNPNMTMPAPHQPNIHQNLPRQQVNWQIPPNNTPPSHSRPLPPTIQNASDRMRGKSPIGSVGSLYTQPTDNSRSASFFSSNSYARQPQDSLSPMASSVSPTSSSYHSNSTAK